MRKIRLVPLLLLAACTTTQQANDSLFAKFGGRTADSFFTRYGPPISSHRLDDGGRVYLWSERPIHFSTPGHTSVSVSGSSTIVRSSPGSDIEVLCQVRIVTSPRGTIMEIGAQSDSIGVWELSRCNELFGK